MAAAGRVLRRVLPGAAAACVGLGVGVCGLEQSRITDEQVYQYHGIKSELRDLDGLRAAMQVEGVMWDFKNQEAEPGRVWHEHTPPELIPLVSRPLTPVRPRSSSRLSARQAEEQQARIACNMNAPRGQAQPRVLIVVGVPAAGKSTIQPQVAWAGGRADGPVQVETLFGIELSEYVAVEGDLIRDAHQGWQEAVMKDPSKGYRDMFDKYCKPVTKPAKKALLAEALSNRQNIIWPVVAKDTQSMVRFVQKCHSHGYQVDLVGLVVGHKESSDRAKNRAHMIGRWNKWPRAGAR